MDQPREIGEGLEPGSRRRSGVYHSRVVGTKRPLVVEFPDCERVQDNGRRSSSEQGSEPGANLASGLDADGSWSTDRKTSPSAGVLSQGPLTAKPIPSRPAGLQTWIHRVAGPDVIGGDTPALHISPPAERPAFNHEAD